MSFFIVIDVLSESLFKKGSNKHVPWCPDTTLDTGVIPQRIHNGREECYNLLIPSHQYPGG